VTKTDVGVAKMVIAPNAHVAARKRNTQATKRTTSSRDEPTDWGRGGGLFVENFGAGVGVVSRVALCAERASKLAAANQVAHGGQSNGLLSPFADVVERSAGGKWPSAASAFHSPSDTDRSLSARGWRSRQGPASSGMICAWQRLAPDEVLVLIGVVVPMALVVGVRLLVVAKPRPASHLLLGHDRRAEEFILLLAAPGRRVDPSLLLVGLEGDLDGVGGLLRVDVFAPLRGR
jgi:hypothetical protein